MTKQEAAARVADGARFLDNEWPDWFKHLNVNELDLACACNCVLGQLTGDFNKAVRQLWPEPLLKNVGAALGLRERRGALLVEAYGFDAPKHKFKKAREVDFRRLQDAWIAEIGARSFPDRPLESTKGRSAVDPSASNQESCPRA